MYSIIKYFSRQQSIFSVLFAIAQNMVNHFLILSIQFTLFDIKIDVKKQLLCSFAITIIYLFPLYLVDFLFFAPGVYFSIWLYTSLIFINPLSALAYYFVIRKTLKLSPTKSNLILKGHLLIHYCIVLIYMLSNSILYGLMPAEMLLQNFYVQEIISIFIIVFLLYISLLIVRLYTNKTQNYITIPPDYSEKNIKIALLKTILVISLFYMVIVFFRVKWLSTNQGSFDLNTSFIYFLLIACVFLYLIISMSSLRSKFFRWETQATETYISSLLHVNQEFRGIRHDFYNVLQTYGGYIEMGDLEGLRKYHQSLFQATKAAGDFLSLIEVLKSRIPVYSLFQSKSDIANKSGVKFSFNQVCDISRIVLTDLDLCRVLGIVIDNAIEAASLSEQKQINLSFEEKDKNTIVFVVSNTTKDDVATEKIFADGFSTKENHSGIGLTQVLHILNSYEHCGSRASYHDNQFTMFLIFHTADDNF